MFPRYIFFKPGAGQSLSAARSTRGVAFILSFGCQPAVLTVEAIEAIRDVERQLGLVDFHRPSFFVQVQKSDSLEKTCMELKDLLLQF